jgi:hydroxymethylpyrimidine pyrophosphatase-like HAD family hydrolase
MHYVALATDYDGTIAHNGEVDDPTLAALDRLRGASRRLVLVTGRELDDLVRCMPRLDLFDIVVAENGAVLYWPATKQERALAPPPPPEFAERLREAGVSPLSVGRVIVASWEPNEGKVLATIREMGLELQIIFNKGAVMVLPAGVNKESGLRAALDELEVSSRNVVAVGDAENDFAFLNLCGMPVAVANALPRLKDAAALVTRGERGEGVAELVDRWLASDLADVDETNPRQQVVLAAALEGEEVPGLALVPVRQSLLLTGISGGGKTTLITGLLERLAENDFQFVVMDPEGDYGGMGNTVAVGSAQAAARTEEVLEILHKTATSVAVNLLAVPLPDRPGYLASLLPELLALRERTGRPHFIVIDEAHHMLPSSWDPGATALPSGLKGFLFVTVRPESLSPRTLDCVDRVMAVGAEARAALAVFARAHSLPEPEGADGVALGEVLTLSLSDPAPRRFKVIPGTTARRRHLRKYAEGTLGDDKAFFFRGPEGKLRLRATNLMMFLEMADGVDDATWEWHRERSDFSGWIETSIKDTELSAAVREIEQGASKADEARQQIRDTIERCYTLPA